MRARKSHDYFSSRRYFFCDDDIVVENLNIFKSIFGKIGPGKMIIIVQIQRCLSIDEFD